MRRIASNVSLFAATLLGVAMLVGGCVTDTTDTSDPDFGGVGGSSGSGQAGSSTAGTGGTAGSGGAAGGGAGGAAGASGAGAGGEAGSAGTGGVAGGAGSGGAAGGTQEPADLRFVHLAPDVGAVDVCFRSGGGEWQGPVFSKLYESPEIDFYYPTVSTYLPIPAGTWEFRLVDDKATDCNTPFSAGFADQTGTLAPDMPYALILEGTNASALKFGVYPDRGVPSAGKVGYQVVNALTATGAVDFGLLDDTATPATLWKLEPDGAALNIPALGADAKGEYAPNSFRPSFFVGGSIAGGAPVPVALGAPIEMGGDHIYEVFAHGTKIDDPTAALRPASIICRIYPTPAEKSSNGDYAAKGNVVSPNCVYVNGDGTPSNQ